jgi:hypothetical protein
MTARACLIRARQHTSVCLAESSLVTGVLAGVSCGTPADLQPPAPSSGSVRARSVCPPFPLRDEAGAPIDPIKGVNDSVPYSPKQT